MKRLLFAFLLICLFCTCKKDPYANLCGGSDPIKNLPWLKAKIDVMQSDGSLVSVTRGLNKDQTLYIFTIYCCPACNCQPGPVYNCDGSVFNLEGNRYSELIYGDQLLQKQIIWRK